MAGRRASADFPNLQVDESDANEAVLQKYYGYAGDMCADLEIMLGALQLLMEDTQKWKNKCYIANKSHYQKKVCFPKT